jgi:serine/threonine protein kinase
MRESDSTRKTLADHLRSGPLDPDVAAQVLWAICAVVEAAHPNAFGEVDPEAVELEGDLALLTPRLQRRAGGAGALAAPERARSGPTPQSDVYALGALLHVALTGRPPDGRPLTGPAAELAPVVERCLSPDPARRYATVAELRQALTQVDGTHVSGPRRAATMVARAAPRQLGPWVLERMLGEGSMGEVFKARHERLGRAAAIKLLRAEQYKSRELVQRFFQEARTVNQINHEHIVEISDFVEEPGADGPAAVYCVMELLDGRSVEAELERGPLTLARALGIVEQLADALAAAHRVGVVHRDVKPENIMLISRAGQSDYVKVLDFGVAKLTAPDHASMVSTMDGTVIGTPVGMSPEQARGEHVDARTDIWAVGVLLFRMLSGRLPFDAPNFAAIAVKICTAPTPPLPERTRTGEPIPAALRALVLGCLEKDRERRPARMEEVRDLVRALRAEVTRVEAPSGGRRGAVVGLAAGLAVLLVGAVATWRLTSQPAPPPVVVAPTPPPVAEAPPVEPAPPAVPSAVAPLAAPEPAPVDADAGVARPDAGAVAPAPEAPRPVRPVALTPAVISAGVKQAQPRVGKCLTAHQADLPRNERAVLVSITIEPSGKVSTVKVLTAGVAGLPVEACIVRAVSEARFPLNLGPARTVKVPFTYLLEP